MEYMILIIIIFIAAIFVIRFAVSYKIYVNSNYYKATQNSYRDVHGNSGLYGEYSLYRHIQSFENIGCKFLFNLYVPRDHDKTSEIDIIMFHPKCLFVIESKNYSGWIFGNEKDKQWTQTLPVRQGKSHKERFYNPIRQNAAHIKAVRKHIDANILVYSVIAFSDKCTFKNITIKSDVIVTHYSKLKKEIKFKLSEINNYTITPDLIDETYNKLSEYANVDDYTKFQHIYNDGYIFHT